MSEPTDARRGAPDISLELKGSGELAPAERRELRGLLDVAFGGRFSEEDWQHSLGGLHAIMRVAGRIVAHGAVVPRRLWIDTRACRACYVEAVAVAAELRGQGHGSSVMRALEPEIERFELGALSTGRQPFYERLGWERWQGTTWVREGSHDSVGAVAGLRRTADEDDGVMVKRTALTGPLDLTARLICESRPGDDW